ncbi:MAG TPA: penicillin-binding protein [bacterium]|nr:penicillin-binding protein [bacterium]
MKSSFKKRPISSNYYHPKTIKTVSNYSIKRKKPINLKIKKINNLFLNSDSKRKLLIFIGGFILICIISFSIFVAVVSRNLPNPDQLLERDIAQSTIIYDRSGENILYEFHGEEKRTLISLDDIPYYAQKATIAIEDKNFYKHSGFSIWAMARTIVTNIIYNRKAGGSTLTQQFVKNALLSSEKKYSRKIKEIIISQRIEKKYSKDEILQMYLNEIPYGSNAYGIEAASQKYFGKSAKNLNLAESALLAALPQAPSRYSPYGDNKDLLIGRQQYILGLMVEQNYISEEEKEEALNYELVFKEPETNITAPHFIMYIKELLSEKYGEKTVEQGGLKIYTTIDLDKQKIAEEAINNQAEKNASKYNANNAALVAIDPKTGQILAMVGSKDYFNEEIDGQVNVAIRDRQPGSSLKPFVYATLFSKGGYNPNTILYDVVTNFSSGVPYEPHNYNGKENGPIAIKKALAGSLNIPAVKALYLAGVNNVINLAKEAGYTTLTDPDKYGLSLVLGGAEVKLLEHTNAYSIFAQEGKINEITGVLKIEDKDGNVLEEYKENKKTVLDANIARMINSILSDNNNRSFVFGESNNLVLSGRTSAAKTGTTNDFKDAWTIGYTPSLITGVWVGNNDSSEMSSGADGSVVAAPIWNEFMRKALANTPNESFTEPIIKKTGKAILDGELIGQTIKINKETKEIATENTPEDLIEEIFITDHHSILYYVDKDNPTSDIPSNPSSDPQFNLWESRVLEWAKKQNVNYDINLINKANDAYNPENIPVFSITNLQNNQTIETKNLQVNLQATAPRGVNKVEYYINDSLLERKTSYPFDLDKDISFLNNGYYKLKVKVCDDVLNCSEQSLEFNLLLSNNVNKIPTSLNLTYPNSGMTLNSDDFPVSINLVATNIEQITKIEIKIKNESNEEQIIKTLDLINKKNIETVWDNSPGIGNYTLYAVYYDWNNSSKETNKITVNIN